MAADVARDGATEALRHAIALTPASASASAACRAVEAPPASPRTAPRLSARPSLSASGGCSGGGGGGGSGDGRAVQDWVLQTLAPLLQHPSGWETRANAASGTIPIVLPGTRRRRSAAELNKSAAEVRAIELSAALGVADALLLQAARGTPPLDGAGRRGPEEPQPLLARLLLQTPLAAGLLALACSGRAPVDAGDDPLHSSRRTTTTRGKTPPSRGQQQPNTNGGGEKAGDAERAAAAAAVATAEAALVVAREAAALCPSGLWAGLRAELLPALAAGGSGSHSVVVGRGSALVDGGDDEVGGVGVGRGVRAGLVLKEMVAGMGTGVVPFAARLLPVALRGMTDTNEQVIQVGVRHPSPLVAGVRTLPFVDVFDGCVAGAVGSPTPEERIVATSRPCDRGGSCCRFFSETHAALREEKCHAAVGVYASCRLR